MSQETKPAAQELPTLDIRGVSKVYRTDVMKRPHQAVNNLYLRFLKGQCTGLLGHNGAGKTTTIRMILGLIEPDTGSIFFEGHPLRTDDKRLIGYMPEINKLQLSLTVKEILDRALRVYSPSGASSAAQRRDRVRAKLESLGLLAHERKKVGQLSKGLARRLAFAQATIHEPRLLILDEPSTGLDPNAAEVLIEHIELEKSRGTTIILCTHELVHVTALCDGFYLMRKGHLIAQTYPETNGTSAEVVDWGSTYGIQVSGITPDSVKRLQGEQNLPPWGSIRIEGKSGTLGFADYQDAARWLGCFLADGYLVLRFGDGRGLTSAQIRSYF